MEEQQVVPAEQSKEHFIKLADYCSTLLDTISAMTKKIVHSEDSSADQKKTCLDHLSNACEVYGEAIQQIAIHFLEHHIDVVDLIWKYFQNNVHANKTTIELNFQNISQAMDGVSHSLEYLIDLQRRSQPT